MNPTVLERMRAEWNERASEDAYFYVAFGRRKQDEREFFATADEVLAWLRDEMLRLETEPGTARALEIGCGPGRLIRPLSTSFQEIHGVDVSDQMIRMAERNLAGIPHAYVHATSGADLGPFLSQSFDFVYSYAVFQHIPSRDVVIQYLREAVRVLKTGGILTCQINGRPEDGSRSTTWNGVCIPAAEVLQLARELDCQVLALDGIDSQYMWTTWRKRTPGWRKAGIPNGETLAGDIRPSGGSDRIVAGRPATFALAVERPHPDSDIADMTAEVQGRPAGVRVIRRTAPDGWADIVVEAAPCVVGPAGVRLYWRGTLVCRPVTVEVGHGAETPPTLVSLTDGVNYLSGARITSRSVKMILDNVAVPDRIHITVDGKPVAGPRWFCVSAQLQRFAWDLFLEDRFTPGRHRLEIDCGEGSLPALAINLGILQCLDVFREAPEGECLLEQGIDGLWSVVTAAQGVGKRCEELVAADLGALPFAAGRFAGIVIRRVPEADAIDEIRRVLKPDGALYMEVDRSGDLNCEALARAAGLPFRWRRDHARSRPGSWAVTLRALWSLCRRALDRGLGTRMARGGAGFYFGREWGPADRRARLNGCVRCGAVYSSAQISAAGTLVSFYPLVLYRCPGCGAANIFTLDR